MKVLNLDALAATKRTITLGGETYAVQEMTVENFIETTRAAERLEAAGAQIPLSDQVEATIESIQRSVPDCPKAVLRRLTLTQLSTVGKFLRGELDGEEAKEPSAEGDAEGKN